jgi:hypothetical protein
VAEAVFDAELPEFCVLGRLDLLPSLAAQDADEAAHCVRLPASGFHDFAQRTAFGSLHHRDHFGFLVGATPFRLAGCLGPGWLLRGLGLLGRLAVAVRRKRFSCRCAVVLRIVAHSLLLNRVAVVTVITRARRNRNQNLQRLSD